MKRNERLALQCGALVLLATGLSACGEGYNPTPTPSPTPTIGVRQEDVFGMPFGMDFRAGANGEPVPVNDGDIVAVSLTTEPVTIN